MGSEASLGRLQRGAGGKHGDGAGSSHRVGLGGGCFRLAKNMSYFPLVVLKGIYHYWICFSFFPRGLRVGGGLCFGITADVVGFYWETARKLMLGVPFFSDSPAANLG